MNDILKDTFLFVQGITNLQESEEEPNFMVKIHYKDLGNIVYDISKILHHIINVGSVNFFIEVINYIHIDINIIHKELNLIKSSMFVDEYKAVINKLEELTTSCRIICDWNIGLILLRLLCNYFINNNLFEERNCSKRKNICSKQNVLRRFYKKKLKITQ